MSVKVNKISLKQEGGQMIPEQPGMQQQTQQPQVDPQVMEISQAIASSVQEGQNPQEVVIALIQNQVDQQVIAQALMMVGMAEEDIITLFEQIERSTQPSSPEEVNANPELLSRNEDIIEQEEQEAAQQNQMMGMAKSGIEIKPENRGKFTAWAKKRGMTVSEAANKVMSNKDRYTTDIVKMANFAKNAAGWNKEYGGDVDNPMGYVMRSMSNFEDGGEQGAQGPKGKIINGVFIPDESEIANDAFYKNLQRQNQYYFPDPQYAVLPMMPPPTVNPLFDIINTAGTVIGDVKGEFSNFGDKVDQYKADKYKYYDVDLDFSDVRSEENINKFKDWVTAEVQELQYQTQENKAKADKQISDLTVPKLTFEQWLEKNPNIINTNTARSMFDSIYNKMFGGSVYGAQRGKETGAGTVAAGIVDADGDGIPDFIDIDGGEGTGVPAYGTVNRPNLEDMYNQINFEPEVNVKNPIFGTIKRLGDNPYIRAGASILGATSDLAGLYNRIADQKTYLKAQDQFEERSGADYKYATKMSGPRTRGNYDALSGQLGSEADRVAGYYMNFAGSPYSFSGTAKEGGEFKPHMMFDPQTGKGYKANVPADHERMADMGYLHKDEMQVGGENLNSVSLSNILGTSMMTNPMMKKLLNLSPSSQKKLIDIYNRSKNISNISEGLEFFNNVSKNDIKKYLGESGINKNEVIEYVENQPFYNNADWLTKQGIKLAMKMKGLKQGGEVVELSQDMIAQLIAAGADIEIL